MNSDHTMTGDRQDALHVVRDFGAEELAYINRMTVLGQVVPNVSHEINNALQIIGGLCELLATKDLPADAKDKIGKIAAQNGRAVELVQQVVGFIRREGLGQSRVDVTRAVQQALAMRRYHLSRAGVQTSVTGPSEGPAIVGVDSHSMQQVMLNLIANAEQALSGREGAQLSIGVSRTGDGVDVVVTDNGRGLTDMVRSRAFEPFFTTHRERAGLGLTVVKAIIERFEGRVELGAAPNGGAQVSIHLPAK